MRDIGMDDEFLESFVHFLTLSKKVYPINLNLSDNKIT